MPSWATENTNKHRHTFGEGCGSCWPIVVPVGGLRALFSDWQYQTGTTGNDYVYGLAIDSNGPVVVGSTAGDLYGTNQGQTQLGAANDDVARSLAVDANDNLWAAGWNGGPSPRTPFIFKMVPPGYGLDVYDHPSSSGTAFFGGITIDSTGNAIAVGGSTGTIDGLTSSGDYDFLLMVYSNAGVKQFTRLTGSSGQDDAYSVTTDSSDNIVVLGETSGSMSGFTNAGVGDDVVVLKYDSSGTLLWTYQWGSASDDWFKSVKTDSSDNIYAAGITAGTLTGANAGGYDMGVFKLNSAAVQQWVVQRGSAGTEQALSMALDLTNDLIYVSGKSDGELDGRTDTGTSAAFVMVFDLAGTWHTTLMMSSVSPATLTFTSTVTVTSARNVASEVLVNFEERQKNLVRQLLENAANETGVPVSTEEPDGTLVLGVAMSDRITVSAPNGLSLAVPTTLLAAAGGSVTLSVAQLGQDSEMVQALEALENQTEEILDENLQF
ncbi:unnamed protein product [Cladocopium goreaui]|uniref:SbsA Ig-like domain-containing protein n=1 Tax=Cladocopium goreaui TaxID=2562237 RepID=A0A9P1FZF2_9DINO|nr:unnamed protein product [Cladocopium goreaui]